MFARIRKEFDQNRTYYAFCAGSIVTSTAFYFIMKDTTLNLPKVHQELLKQGGAVVYKTKDQTLHLVNIAAAEAANNL